MTTNGGEICSATPRRARVITPWRRAAATAAAAGGRVGRDRSAVELDGAREADAADLRHARRARAAARAARARTGSSSATRSTSRSRSRMSRLTRPATQAPGWPAYVPPWRNGGRGLVPERRAHPAADDDRAERDVAGADPLRAGDQVGREAVALAAEPAAEPAEAGDHLVGDEQDVALAADALDLGPVAVGRRDRAAGADHRLADEGGGAARRARRATRARSAGSSCGDLGDVADERAVAVADGRDPGERGAVGVRAVVREAARHDHRPLRLPDERPVAPDDLRRRVDRLAAAGAEEDGGVGDGRQLGDALARARARARSRGRRRRGAPRACGAASATASAISARPWPTFANQRPAVASRYSLPSASQTRQPSPRTSTSSWPSTFPIAANGCQRRVVVVRESVVTGRPAYSGGCAARTASAVLGIARRAADQIEQAILQRGTRRAWYRASRSSARRRLPLPGS